MDCAECAEKRGYGDPDELHICYKCYKKLEEITFDCAECAEKRRYGAPDGLHICYKCSQKINEITVDCAECAEEVYYPPNRLLICKVCYKKLKIIPCII